MSLRPVGAAAPFVFVACTSILGIDGKYVIDVSTDAGSSGGRSSNGGNESGGTDESGGAPSAGGAASGGFAGGGTTGGRGSTSGESGGGGGPTSCESDAAACAPGEKCCPIPQPSGSTSKNCVPPIPLVGCSSDRCDSCPAPPMGTGIAICDAKGACDFECISGYKKVGSGCEPTSTGTGGAGGAPSACVAQNCPPGCGFIGPLACCRNDGKCGCTWAPGAVCY